MSVNSRCVTILTIATAIGPLFARACAAEGVDGFTQPYRSINVCSMEVATIASIEVKEGDEIRGGQVLAILDHELLNASLTVARQAMQAHGRLNSAQAELELRENRLKKLQTLQSQGHARPDEVERALADVAIAAAQLLAAQEDLEIKRLEHERIKAQIERRFIRSPIDGVVSRLEKDVGELVAPNSPEIVTVVQLDTLMAVFLVPKEMARQLAEGQELPLQIAGSKEPVPGVIETISPLIDAESGTVRIKIRVDNRQGQLRSGERCLLQQAVDSPP